MIMIHVHDDTRNTTKDYPCPRPLLLRHMRYFHPYLTPAPSTDIDISVHCDIHIFDFLVRFMESPDRPPPLTDSTVVSVLISSDFLQMDDLVNLCLRHVARRLSHILGLPVDLACITDGLCAKLAKLTPAEALVGVEDPKGKLLPRIYKKRLEVDFRERPSRRGSDGGVEVAGSCLVCCRRCRRLYSESEVKSSGCVTRCPRLSTFAVGERGDLTPAPCEPATPWSLTTYVASLRRQGMPWEDIYWMLWAASHPLCLLDGTLVNADQEYSGTYHPGKPTFVDQDLWGAHSCCGATASRLSPWTDRSGCAPAPVQLAPTGGAGAPPGPGGRPGGGPRARGPGRRRGRAGARGGGGGPPKNTLRARVEKEEKPDP